MHAHAITPHACARGKAIGFVIYLSVCLSVCQHKNHQIWRSRHHSKMQVSLWCWEDGKTYLLWPSRRLKSATSAINGVFLLATPLDHTQLCHVLPRLHML